MHIKELSIENFRSFKNRETFNLAPISLFCGTNNSGKSSILKALLLLKESSRSNNLSSLNFKGGVHNLGSFRNTINNTSERDEMVFEIKTGFFIFNKENTEEKNQIQYYPKQIDYDITGELIFGLSRLNKKPIKYLCKYVLTYKKSEIYTTSLLDQNDEELFYYTKKNNKTIGTIKLPVEIIKLDYLTSLFDEYPDQKIEECIDNLFNYLYKKFTEFSDISIITLPYDYYSIETGFTKPYNDYFKCIDAIDMKTHEELDTIQGDDGEPIHISNTHYRNNLVADIISDIINIIKSHNLRIDYAKITNISSFVDAKLIESLKYESTSMYKVLSDVDYIPAVRSSQEFFYKYESQGSGINKLIDDYHSRGINKEDEEWVNSKLLLFNLGEKVEIREVQNIGYQVIIKNGDKEYFVTELGFGFSQLFPILMKVILNKRGILMIEEPEANLHPKLQSLLADLFIDAYMKFGVQFIIETHSEYFIRKLQYNVAKKIIQPEMVSIHYIESNNLQIPKAYSINILSDGGLSKNFGEGFFDEITNIQFELLKLKQIQSN